MTEFISRRDLSFQLQQVHRLDQLLRYERFNEHDVESCNAMLDAAIALADEQFLAHAALADAQEPHFDGERVHQPALVKAALDA